MYIRAFSVSNYRGFNKAEFKFHRGLNLIIGINGSGKSSILRGIRSALGSFVGGLAKDGSNAGLQVEDVRLEYGEVFGKVRYERMFPTKLQITCSISNVEHSWTVELRDENPLFGVEPQSFQIGIQFADQLGVNTERLLPLIVFYGPFRNGAIGGGSIGTAASERVSRLDAYKSWSNAFPDRTALENWVIGKTLEKLQLLSESISLPEEADELSLVNRAISDCIPDCRGLKFDLRRRSLIVDFGDHFLPFSNLSDGQQNIIALFADIARRMCLLNPQMGSGVFRQTTGIVSVDEIDVHLHPSWQKSILQRLQSAFPSIQFLLTSHSPQMIGGLRPDQVRLLKNGGFVSPQITFGLDSSSILEEIMEVTARPTDIDDSLRRIHELIESGSLMSAINALTTLKSLAPDLPDYAQIEALIRRKEIIGR